MSVKVLCMINFENSGKDFYFCSSADWSTVVVAESEIEAAGLALANLSDELGEELLVSPAMRIRKIAEDFEDADNIVCTSEVFADIGMHEQASILERAIK